MSDGKFKYSFVHIPCRTDGELSEYLSAMAERGLSFVSARGNFLKFSVTRAPAGKWAVRTVVSDGSGLSMAEIAAAESARLREMGWECVFVSSQETLADRRRHLFLIRERDGAPDIPISAAGSDGPARRSCRRAASTFALGVLLLLFSAFVFLKNPVSVLFDSVLLCFYAVFALGSVAVFLVSLWLLVLPASVSTGSGCPRRRAVADGLSAFLFVFLLFSAVFLIADGMVRKGPSPVKRAGGQGGRAVYGCAVPFSASDAGMMSDGEFRSAYFRESRSCFGRKITFYDESFDCARDDPYSLPRVSRLTSFNCVAVVSGSNFARRLFRMKYGRAADSSPDGHAAFFEFPGFSAYVFSVGAPMEFSDGGELLFESVAGA